MSESFAPFVVLSILTANYFEQCACQTNTELPYYQLNTTLPFPVESHILLYYDPNVYLIGGYNTSSGSWSNSVFSIQANYLLYDREDEGWDMEDTVYAVNGTDHELHCYSHCWTQMSNTDRYVYIIYGYSDYIYEYNLDSKALVPHGPFDKLTNMDAEYCLTNNGSHIFVVGPTLILIIHSGDLDTISHSHSFFVGSSVVACATDYKKENVYIFSNKGGGAVFKYNIDNDSLTTLDTHYLRYLDYLKSDSLNALASFDADGLLYITDDSDIYVFSQETDNFLKCTIPTTSDYSVLLQTDDHIYDTGGQDSDSIVQLSALTALNSINMRHQNWFFPGVAIPVRYNPSMVLNDNYTQIHISSYELGNTSVFYDIGLEDGNCSLCDGLNQRQECNTETGIYNGACKDGFEVTLTGTQINALNKRNKGSTMVYSIELTGSNGNDSVCTSNAIYPVYLDFTFRLVSDEQFNITFKYEYRTAMETFDSQDNNVSNFNTELKFKAPSLGIKSTLDITITNGISCWIEDKYHCDSGYPIDSLNELYFDGDYPITVSSSDTLLKSNQVALTINKTATMCRHGSGYGESANACFTCADDSFSMTADLSQCISCKNIDGISCEGSTSVKVDYKYWVAAYNENDDKYYKLQDMSQDDILVASICGYGQCCDKLSGCDYVDNVDKLCSENRDITSVMCLSCEDDYYEMWSSNSCGKCDSYKNSSYLIGVFVGAAAIVIYLAVVDARPMDKYIETMKINNKPECDINAAYFILDSFIFISALIWQIFVYYFQTFAFLLLPTGSRIYVSPILNLFNLNFDNDAVGEKDDSGFCGLPRITAMTELLMSLMFPFFMFVVLMILYSCCGRTIQKYVSVYTNIAFFRILVVVLGVLFQVLFQLLACVHLDGDQVWQFYYDQPCYGGLWFAALFGLILFCVYFVSIFKKIYQMSDKHRMKLDLKYTKLIQAYRPQMWYWELVITLRRFLIALFISIQYIGQGTTNLILCALLIAFLIAHTLAKPFKHSANNQIEAFCLLSVIIAFIGTNLADIEDSTFMSVFLVAVVFAPLLLAIYYIFRICTDCRRYTVRDMKYFEDRMDNKRQSKVSQMKKNVLNRAVTLGVLPASPNVGNNLSNNMYGGDDDDDNEFNDDESETDDAGMRMAMPTGSGGNTNQNKSRNERAYDDNNNNPVMNDEGGAYSGVHTGANDDYIDGANVNTGSGRGTRGGRSGHDGGLEAYSRGSIELAFQPNETATGGRYSVSESCGLQD